LKRHKAFYPPIGEPRGNHIKPPVAKISIISFNYLLEGAWKHAGVILDDHCRRLKRCWWWWSRLACGFAGRGDLQL
jgi:hypothetical protein